MNYFEWSNEYSNTAKEIACVIDKLKTRRKIASVSEKKAIDLKLTKYRMYYKECINIANHLMLRHEGVA